MRVTLLVGISATICLALCSAKSLPSQSRKLSSHNRNLEGAEEASNESKRVQEEDFNARGSSSPFRHRKDTERSENIPLKSHKTYAKGDDVDDPYHHHNDDGEYPHKTHDRKDEQKPRKIHKEPNQSSKKRVSEDDSESILDYDDIDPATKELFEIARQQAIQVIVEKMLIAFGPDFVPQRLPDNDTMPTVSSPLNITTEPCPEIYAQCSSQNIFSSCKPPRHSHKGLWKQRFNLYFDLPSDLLEKYDELLGATLRIYKHSPLPLKLPTPLIVEIYSYTKSLTLKRDWNKLRNSTKVSSDFVGWVSLDLTDLIRNWEPKKNHGFLIKVRDINGIHWNAPEHFIPMNCSDSNKSLVPVPFGVMTEEPEQKYPSLAIHTGKKYPYYTELVEEEGTRDYEDDSYLESRKEEREEEVSPHYEEEDPMTDYLVSDDQEMPSDDPFVHKNTLVRYDDDDNESLHVRHGRKNSPHQTKFQKIRDIQQTQDKGEKMDDRQQTQDKEEKIDERRSNLPLSISSIEEETISSTKIWKKSNKNAGPAIYETQITFTKKRPQLSRRKHPLSHHEWEPISHRNQPSSEEERETGIRHPRQRRSSESHLQVMS